MEIKKFLTLLFLIGVLCKINAQTGNVHNNIFKPGEEVTYKIYYHWHFVWVEAGEVTFTVSARNYHGIPAYYFYGTGHSYHKYDWFYMVRDTFQTYLDTNDFSPLRFTRYSNEGSSHVKNDNIFDVLHHKAYYFSSSEDDQYKRDSISIPSYTFDPLSGIYYTRCINFNNYKANDTIPMNLYLDDHVYDIHIRYLGKEEISSSFGKLRCIKFKVSLVSGTIFKAGQEMTVWGTDDNDHIPVYVEAPILIGSIRAELLSFSNLRNPMDAKVK